MESKKGTRRLNASWDQLESLMNSFPKRPLNKEKPSKRSTYLRSVDHTKPKMNLTFTTGFGKSQSTIEKKKLENTESEVSLSLVKNLYFSRCEDLIRPPNPEQESIFIKNFYNFQTNRFLNLQNMNLSLASTPVISEILMFSTKLTRINLSKNNFGSKGCLEICVSAKKNSSIIELNLGNNSITPIGIENIFNSLVNESLISISLASEENLHKNILGTCENIEKVLKSKTLMWLNLAGTGINQQGFQKIINGLKGNIGLVYLNISKNYEIRKVIGDLMISLSKSKIQELVLSENKIKDKTAEAIGKMFNENTCLKKLDLSDNLLTEVGIGEIFSMLSGNHNVKSLNLSRNIFRNEVPLSFTTMCSENTMLEELFLSGCNLGKLIVGFIEGLSSNDILRKLDLSFNKIENTGAELLSLGILKNSGITSLNLSFNRIKDDGGLALARALKQNSVITEINLKENEIKSKTADEFSILCRKNQKITKLNLELNPAHQKYSYAIHNILTLRNKSNKFNCVPHIKTIVGRLRVENEIGSVIYSKLSEKNSEYKQNIERITKQNEKLVQAKDLEEQKLLIIKNERKVIQLDLNSKTETLNSICQEKIVNS